MKNSIKNIIDSDWFNINKFMNHFLAIFNKLFHAHLYVLMYIYLNFNLQLLF
jgi:hypothetical protein